MDATRIGNEQKQKILLSVEPVSSRELMPRYYCDFSNPFIHKILDSIPDIVFILNKNQRIVFANNSFVKFAGASSAEAVRSLYPGQALGCVHSSLVGGDCGASEQCSKCCLIGNLFEKDPQKGKVRECILSRKDGAMLEFRVWSAGFQLNDKPYFFFSVYDVSEEKRKRILEKIFFHDLLNTVGCMYSTVSLMKQVSLEKYGRLTDIILDSSKILIDEIEAQLELNAAENNELAVHPERLNSLWLLYQVAGQYKNHRIARDRMITVDPESEEFDFISDRMMSRRVLSNLVKNALEAVEPSQTVKIGCRVIGENGIFWVQNPGCIPCKVKDQIFQRACSTKGKGRGIGTYSIRLLTERYLEGKVGFETSVLKGTRFQLILPLKLKSSGYADGCPLDSMRREYLNRRFGGDSDGIVAEEPR